MKPNLKEAQQSAKYSITNCQNLNRKHILQKDHNDSHIFYLKTSSDPNFDQQIFSLNFQQKHNLRTKLNIRIKSKKNFHESPKLNQYFSANYSPNESRQSSVEFQKMNSSTVQRQNTNSNEKNSLQFNLKTDQVASLQKMKTTPFTLQNLKLNRKNKPNRKQNYFNVKDLQKSMELKTYQNAAIMMRGNMNHALKKIKQGSFQKLSEIKKKIKPLQFNAIEITKSIIGKNQINSDRTRFKDNSVNLKPSYSSREYVKMKQKSSSFRDGKNQVSEESKIQQQKQLWRSTSYLIPQKRRSFFDDVQKDHTKKKQQTYKNVKKVRLQRYDNLTELNPWNQGFEQKPQGIKIRFMQTKTQKFSNLIERKREDENEFINYYINKSSKAEKKQDS